MRIELKGEYEDQSAEMTLELSRLSQREAGMVIEFSAGGHAFSFPCTLLGHDLARLVDDLQRIHTSLEGTAQLSSFDEDVEVNFTVEDAGRGIVSIHGRLYRSFVGVPGNVLHSLPSDAGFEVRFGGFLVDQTYLPDVMEKINRFLRDSEVSTQSPWE